MPERVPEYQTGQSIPGTVYRVHRVIGSGGMGTVYDVEDLTVGKRYVLKTLHGDLKDRTDLAARLAREARALAKLQHPNIVEVYTSGTTTDSLRLPYYVMEKLTGGSLRAVLAKKRLTLEQALDIGIDLLDALDHAHEFGIIHRDVKPDNIYLTRGRDGRSLAKLLDFGIIKLATGPASSATMHTGGRFIGTFRYAPPEQIVGRDVTPQSDLYAAGLVLYEMLAGRGPFDDFTGEMEVGKAHIHVAPPPLSRFAQVPAPIEQLVMSALQKEPTLRPRDAFTFASALRDFKRQLAGGGAISVADSRSPTRQALALQPASDARPAKPFDAQPSVIDAMAQSPHMDAQGQFAPTAIDPMSMSARSQTLALGVLPQHQGTYAAGPVEIQSAPQGLVDRRAETREAQQHVQRPHYDTAPIPLAVFARPASTPPPKNETFGAHTTETSERKKSARSLALVFATIGALAFVTIASVGVFVVWKQRHPSVTQSSSPVAAPTQTSATEAPTQSASAAAIPVETATATTTTSTTAESATSAPVALPVAHAASSTTTHTTHTTTAVTANTPPIATAAPQTTATAAPTTTHHRIGSGL